MPPLSLCRCRTTTALAPLLLALLIATTDAFHPQSCRLTTEPLCERHRHPRAAPMVMEQQADPNVLTSRRSLLIGGGLAAAAAATASKQLDPSSKPFTLPPGSLDGRTVLITGANTGLGFESAKRLAAAGAKVVVTARTAEKAEAAVMRIRDAVGSSGTLIPLTLDLADLASVKGFPAKLEAALGAGAGVDVLMNNAGVMAIPEHRSTKDGFERQLGVNHLGHFALVAGLLPFLKRAANGFRVINVSSEAHKFVDGKQFAEALDQQLDPAEYSAWGNYGLSKAANVLFSKELQRRLDAAGIRASAVSLHPGGVDTDLGRFIPAASAAGGIEAVEAGVPMSELYTSLDQTTKAVLELVKNAVLIPVDVGANTQVWLAAAADAAGDYAASGGEYFDKMRTSDPRRFTEDETLAKRLWELSEQLVGVKIAL